MWREWLPGGLVGFENITSTISHFSKGMSTKMKHALFEGLPTTISRCDRRPLKLEFNISGLLRCVSTDFQSNNWLPAKCKVRYTPQKKEKKKRWRTFRHVLIPVYRRCDVRSYEGRCRMWRHMTTGVMWRHITTGVMWRHTTTGVTWPPAITEIRPRLQVSKQGLTFFGSLRATGSRFIKLDCLI